MLRFKVILVELSHLAALPVIVLGARIPNLSLITPIDSGEIREELSEKAKS